MPSPQRIPAASASAVSGRMPRPATTTSAQRLATRGPHGGPVSALLDADDGIAGEDAHALLLECPSDERGEVLRVRSRADRLLREDHRHRLPVLRERRGELGADEPAADHDDIAPRDGAQAAVVGVRAVVDDPLAADREPSGRAARREEQAIVAVFDALIVVHHARAQVDRRRSASEVEVDAGNVPQPDALLRLAQPQPLVSGGRA
jgi:hypothetical protein